jgi:hypothetical protein
LSLAKLNAKIAKLQAERDKLYNARHQYPWRIGQKVRYIRDLDWGPNIGAKGTIVSLLHEPLKNPNDYCAFHVRVGRGTYWTTPDDVDQLEA